jgi:hypothetical protein
MREVNGTIQRFDDAHRGRSENRELAGDLRDGEPRHFAGDRRELAGVLETPCRVAELGVGGLKLAAGAPLRAPLTASGARLGLGRCVGAFEVLGLAGGVAGGLE